MKLNDGEMWRVVQGDCRDVLGTLEPGTLDLVVTSPPYASQRDGWYQGCPEAEYPAWTVAWMSEVARVLKPSGSVFINIRPHQRNGFISPYVLRTRVALLDAGWHEVDELIWDKKGGTPMGRNDRPRRSWEHILWFARFGDIYCDPKSAGQARIMTSMGGNQGGALKMHGGWMSKMQRGDTFMARCTDVISINPADNGGLLNAHSAAYPYKLASQLIRLACPEMGVVFDPFTGSGTTGWSALLEGRRFIGSELELRFAELASQRCADVERMGLAALKTWPRKGGRSMHDELQPSLFEARA